MNTRQNFYFSHFYAVADSDENHESIRLGLLFQEEGDMRLVDEGYITLTYNDPIPEVGFQIVVGFWFARPLDQSDFCDWILFENPFKSYSFVETSAGFVDSYKGQGSTHHSDKST